MALLFSTALPGQTLRPIGFPRGRPLSSTGADGLGCFLVWLQGLLDLDVLAHACGVYKPPPGAVLADEQDKQARGIKTFNRRDSWSLAGASNDATTPSHIWCPLGNAPNAV